MNQAFCFTRKDIAQLRQLCEFLDLIPYKSAYDLATRPQTRDASYWTTSQWAAQRQYADCIFYTNAWGWQLRKHWKERLAFLEAGLPVPDAVVLGGHLSQPKAYDAVLSRQLACQAIRPIAGD